MGRMNPQHLAAKRASGREAGQRHAVTAGTSPPSSSSESESDFEPVSKRTRSGQSRIPNDGFDDYINQGICLFQCLKHRHPRTLPNCA